MPAERDQMLSHYRLVEKIGAGGMGVVWKAEDTVLGRTVAVKVLPAALALDAERRRLFLDEARLAASVSHGNIVQVHELGRERGIDFIVMEHVEGQALSRLLEESPLPPERVAAWGLQVAQGLARAHRKGLIHRDLKPANIIVTSEGELKIVDFGLAALYSPPDSAMGSDAFTRTAAASAAGGGIAGTLPYMSPEQVRGEKLDARSDIFSFGTMLYEMTTGRRPFRGATPAVVAQEIQRSQPPPVHELVRGVPLALHQIIEKTLSRRREDRYQHMDDVAVDLRRLGKEIESGSARMFAPPPHAAPPRSRSVAVLPFKDLAGAAANDHLGLGLADATITELALVKSLLVRPTAAILAYQGRLAEPQRAARELGVDAVVDGSFQRVGQQLRVTVQLVSAADGRSLWGAKVDATLDDVFRLQDEVSRRIAQALEVELTPADERRLARAATGAGPAGEAYEHYARGRLHLLRETSVDFDAAVACLERAVAADPAFATAWATLAGAYSRLDFEQAPEGSWHERARSACERALALDPELPEARYARARLVWSPRGGWDHRGGIREFAAALAGRPGLNEARDRLGTVLFHVGLVEAAEREFEQALTTYPEDSIASTHLGSCLYLRGAYADAAQRLETGVARAASAWSLYLLALSQARLGLLEAAGRSAERLVRDYPYYPGGCSALGVLAAQAGDAERARQKALLTAACNPMFGHYHHAEYDLGCLYARLGETGAAVAWLRRAAREGFPCAPLFASDPWLDPLRQEASFVALLAELETAHTAHRALYTELFGADDRSRRPS
jgi:TolB-like protein/Tfp pilus assembly protein PilF